MDTRASVEKNLTSSHHIQLPEPVLATIDDIIDVYLKGKLATKWYSYPYLAKAYVNSFTSSIHLGKLFQDIPQARERFCDQLKTDLRGVKDMISLDLIITALGQHAEGAYTEAKFYSTFFLVAHLIRGLLVSAARKTCP